MAELGRRVVENSNELTRRTALAIDRTVIFATPVDEGRARSNWIVSLGGLPPAVNLPPFVPGEEGSTAAANAQAAVLEGAAVIDRYRGQGVIVISNTLPYIVPLNEGSSDQAPAGFIEEAVLAGTETVRRARILDRRLR